MTVPVTETIDNCLEVANQIPLGGPVFRGHGPQFECPVTLQLGRDAVCILYWSLKREMLCKLLITPGTTLADLIALACNQKENTSLYTTKRAEVVTAD
jgi:hypothetical protein